MTIKAELAVIPDEQVRLVGTCCHNVEDVAPRSASTSIGLLFRRDVRAAPNVVGLPRE